MEGLGDPLCPHCSARNVGRVGTGQYYCWDCFIEFSINQRGIRMYRVEPDGELSRMEDASAGQGMEGVL